MKKTNFLLILAAFIVLFACKKDEETSPFDAKFTDKEVATIKSDVDDAGGEAIEHLQDLAESSAVEIMMHFGEISEGGDALKSTQSFFEPLELLQSLGAQGTDMNDLLQGLKSTNPGSTNNISSYWADAVGKYTYNFTTEKFDKTALDDKIVIEFPGKETDETNTAVITVDNFGTKVLSNLVVDVSEEFGNEVPTSVDVDLSYNGTSVAGFEYRGSFQDDGMPKKVSLKLMVDKFSLLFEVVHSPYSEASLKYSLKFEDQIILEWFYKMNGNWSTDNISNVMDDPNSDMFSIGEILSKANAHFIFMNIKVAAMVDIKSMMVDAEALDAKEETLTDEQFVDEVVDIMNDNAELVVLYSDKNTKLAEAEAYKEYDEYWEEYYPSMRFVYADGSKVDVDTYVTEELDVFFVELNRFIDLLNTEYDLGLDNVEP